MRLRPLGKTNLKLPPIGFGAFKIGRNTGSKYPSWYKLPSDEEVETLLNGILDLGTTYVDTAPAYGTSEERIGRAIARRRNEFVLSTKVGETFEHGVSQFDFSASSVILSVSNSLGRLKTVLLDIVFVHSNGEIEHASQPECVYALKLLKRHGLIRAIGMSAKTPDGTRKALPWADVVMVEYNPQNTASDAVMREAMNRGVGVIVKKGLGSGHLSAEQAIPFILSHPAVTSLVIGGLDLEHFKANLALANT